MARRVFFAMAVLPLLFALAHSQDSSSGCLTSLGTSLPGCVTYISNSSSAAKPDQSTCCTPLTKVLNTRTDLECICALNTTYPTYYQKALGLPKACNLSIIVSDSNCTSSSTPAGSPPSKSSPSSSAAFAALAACLLWPLVALLL